MNDKSRVIQAQNILKQDLNYFKSEQQNELNYYKNSRLQQNQVQKIRQDLNARIIRLNQDVKNMRKNEEQIRNKDESLKLLEFDYQYQYNQRNLEQRLEDFQNEIIYYRTPFRDLDTSNDLSFLEPPNQQFKTSFQKQGENDLIDFSNLNLDDSDNQGLTKNFSFQQSNEDSTEINTNIHEQFKQKLLHNKQQRVQAKSILDGHSFWLKNLKDQINKNIYNVQTTKKSYHQHNRSMF